MTAKLLKPSGQQIGLQGYINYRTNKKEIKHFQKTYPNTWETRLEDEIKQGLKNLINNCYVEFNTEV